MKILIIHDEKQNKRISIVEKIIKKHNIDVNRSSYNDVWNSKKYKSPIENFSDVTHILFMLKLNPFEKLGFIFYSGYAFGKKLPVILMTDHLTSDLPKNFEQFIIKIDITSIEDYLIEEQQLYKTTIKKELARATLIEKGYSCFNENFIATVKNDNIEIVKIFIDAGFSPSVCNTQGTPALSIAVRDSLFNMAKFLLESGADVNQLSEDRNYSALMDATQIGDYKNAKMLLSNGANPNLHSKDGQTALILAVGRNDPKLVQLLVEHGADPKYKDALGMSALKYAKLFNNPQILKTLND